MNKSLNEDEFSNKNKKRNFYKYLVYLFIILCFTVLILYLSLRGKTTYKGEEVLTIEAIYLVLKSMNIGYIFLFIAIMLLINFLGASCLFLFARLYTKKYKFYQAIANHFEGVFYKNITPGGSGGQIAQVLTFKKQGINVSNAASVMVMQYIIYQTCMMILNLLSLFEIKNVLNIGIIKVGNSEIPILIFIIIGFALNFIIICTLYFMSFSRRFHSFVLNNVMGFLGKMKLIKNVEDKRMKLRIQVENFRIELRRLSSNIPFTILLYLINFLILILTYLYPFFIGIAINGFDFSSVKVFDKMFESVSLLSFNQMICGIIPIPGGAGISEYIFTSLFANYFSNDLIGEGAVKAVMLLWRTFTFYIPFFVSGIIAATYKSSGEKLENRIYTFDKKTMLTIQLDTYEERKNSSDLLYNTSMISRKEVLDKLKKRSDKEK